MTLSGTNQERWPDFHWRCFFQSRHLESVAYPPLLPFRIPPPLMFLSVARAGELGSPALVFLALEWQHVLSCLAAPFLLTPERRGYLGLLGFSVSVLRVWRLLSVHRFGQCTARHVWCSLLSWGCCNLCWGYLGRLSYFSQLWARADWTLDSYSIQIRWSFQFHVIDLQKQNCSYCIAYCLTKLS